MFKLHRQRYHNREPELRPFGDFGRWILDHREISITNDMIENNFFREIFRHLELTGMCFSSGAFVFQNDTNALFNLLTFNKLAIDDNSYYCDTVINGAIVTPSRQINIIGTLTHNKFYKKKNKKIIPIKPRDCMPVPLVYKTNTRFERVLNPDMEYICGFCNNPKTDTSETKGVIMYYPFYIDPQSITPSNYPGIVNTQVNKYGLQMLYVKFEHHPAGGNVTTQLAHLGDLTARTTGNKPEYPNPRREDDTDLSKCNYNVMYMNRDIEFYQRYCPQDIAILKWYNRYIRTGCEFFVSNGLLQYFLRFLFIDFNCSPPNPLQTASTESAAVAPAPAPEPPAPEPPAPEPPAEPPAPPAQLNSEEIGCRSIDYTYRELVNDYQNPKDTAYTGIIGQIQSYFNKHPELKCKYKSTYTIDDLSAIHKACSINNVSEIKNIICQPSGGRKTRKIRKNKKTRKNKKINKRKRKNTHKKI